MMDPNTTSRAGAPFPPGNRSESFVFRGDLLERSTPWIEPQLMRPDPALNRTRRYASSLRFLSAQPAG
jgi:hypothetical protein